LSGFGMRSKALRDLARVARKRCDQGMSVAEALEPGQLKRFYQSIARSEERHYELFLALAEHYLEPGMVQQRWDELLDIEADIIRTLPIRAALH